MIERDQIVSEDELNAYVDGELPADRHQLAAITHPNVWYWHGGRQVRAWYADCARRGLLIVPPAEEWRAVLAAADVLVGDHGSVTSYAAAAGIPVALAAFPGSEVDPDSQAARLAQIAPALRADEPAETQLTRARAAWTPKLHEAFGAEVTSAPGRAARIIRAAMYRLMRLREPAEPPEPEPVAVLAASQMASGAQR